MKTIFCPHLVARAQRAEVVHGLGDDLPVHAEHDAADRQGLTLVHFSAQHKRFLWDRGRV